MKKLGIISNGKKQIYLFNYLSHYMINVELINNLAFKKYDYIIGSIPFAKKTHYLNCDFYSSYPIETFIDLLSPNQTFIAGGINEIYYNYLLDRKIKVYDILNSLSFVQNNSKHTAEGLIGKIITSCDFSLFDKNVLVIGYGNCGKEICSMLKMFNCDIYFIENNADKIKEALNNNITQLISIHDTNEFKNFDLIINTVPTKILSINNLKELNADCIIYDLSSSPYGFDGNEIIECKSTLHTISGIPGKYMAKASGELIGQNILSYIKGDNFHE